MNNLKIISTVAVLMVCFSGIEASDRFNKIHTKQMAEKGDANYNYKVINSKEELDEFKKKKSEIGMNLSKARGRNVKNYVEIKNVKESRVGSGGYHRGSKLNQNKGNLGIQGKVKNNMKITNTVKIQNSRISGQNMGVNLQGRGTSGLNIGNNVDIKNSQVK